MTQTNLTQSLWAQACDERRLLFSQGKAARGRFLTEVAAVALVIVGIAETIIQGIGALLGMCVCFIPSDDSWKTKCLTWIGERVIALEGAMVTTCCCCVQLFTNLWEDREAQTLQRARDKIQKYLDLGCSAPPRNLVVKKVTKSR